MAAANVTSVETAYTSIQSQVAYGNALKLSNSKLNYQKVLAIGSDKITINFESILTDYRYFLYQHVKTLTLNDLQYQTYRFRPKTLSNEMYGTVELAPLLMDINNVISVAEFDFKTLKVFDDKVVSFLNEVLTKEKTKIAENTSEVETDLVTTVETTT